MSWNDEQRNRASDAMSTHRILQVFDRLADENPELAQALWNESDDSISQLEEHNRKSHERVKSKLETLKRFRDEGKKYGGSPDNSRVSRLTSINREAKQFLDKFGR